MITDTNLTPSELLYFHGDQFTKNGLLNDSHILIHNQRKVSIMSLASVLLLTALLANEQKGMLQLKMGTEKAMFGLITNRFAHAVVLKSDHNWPDNSLEAQIYPITVSLQQKYKYESVPVWHIVREFFPQNVNWPHLDIIKMTLSGLHHRNIITTDDKKRYVASPDMADFVMRQSIAPIQNLITASETGRPELHKLVNKEIKNMLSRCIIQEERDISDNVYDRD